VLSIFISIYFDLWVLGYCVCFGRGIRASAENAGKRLIMEDFDYEIDEVEIG